MLAYSTIASYPARSTVKIGIRDDSITSELSTPFSERMLLYTFIGRDPFTDILCGLYNFL